MSTHYDKKGVCPIKLVVYIDSIRALTVCTDYRECILACFVCFVAWVFLFSFHDKLDMIDLLSRCI